MEILVLILRAQTMPLGNIMKYMKNILGFLPARTMLVRPTVQKHPFSSSVEIQVNLFDLLKLRRNLCKLPRQRFLDDAGLIL